MINYTYPFAYAGFLNESLSRHNLRVVVPPITEPVTLAEARLHLRLDEYGSPPAHPDDDLITLLISAAREWCEAQTGRALAPTTYELSLGAFPSYASVAFMRQSVMLPTAPVMFVESVTYVDANGLPVVMIPTVDYLVDTWSEPGWLYPAFNVSWPTSQAVPNAVAVRFQAGYSGPNDSPQDRPLPKSVRAAMLLVLTHLYENRSNSTAVKLEDIPLGAVALLEQFRLRLSMA